MDLLLSHGRAGVGDHRDVGNGTVRRRSDDSGAQESKGCSEGQHRGYCDVVPEEGGR